MQGTARNLPTDTFVRPNGNLDPNGHSNPIAQKLRMLLMHLGLDGSRLMGVSWCSSPRYRAADHHHHHRHHHHKKKVGCGVGDGAHAHRKSPKAHCKGACTRICCRGLLGQVTPIPSSTTTFDVVRWPHVTWVGMLFDLVLRRLPFGRIHSVEPRPTSDGTSSASCTLVLMELGYWGHLHVRWCGRWSLNGFISHVNSELPCTPPSSLWAGKIR